MEPTLGRFIWRYSARAQLSLIGLALAAFPFLWLFYEMPKEIVELIGGTQAAGPFTLLGLPLPQTLFGEPVTRAGVLLADCAVLLVLVIINQRFKYWINTRKGITAERMLRRLRFQVLSLVLRFPLHAFRQRTAGETTASLGGDLEALCTHVGDAVAVPAYQGGTLLVILGFLAFQDPLIALAAVTLFPVSMMVVPRLQAQVNTLSRERSRLMRGLGERIDETFHLVADIHANDQTRWTRAWLGLHLGEILAVRFDLYRRKYAIKAINNFIQALGPILFYAIGGLLVLEGRLDLGTLVAAVAAHRGLATPWEELLNWYQAREDARVKYENTRRLFYRPDLWPDEQTRQVPAGLIDFRGQAITIEDLVLRDEDENIRLDRVRLTLAPGKLTALVGPPGGGREALAQAIAGLVDPSAGQLRVAGHDLSELPASIVNRRIAYVGAAPALQACSIADNLAFGLRLAPRLATTEPDRWQREALRAGNPPDPLAADWIDYGHAGVDGPAALRERMIALMGRLGFGDELFRLGLRESLSARAAPDLAAGIVAARALLAQRLAESGAAGMIAGFDPQAFNDHATLAENLLFGVPADGTFTPDRLADHPFIHALLARRNLLDPLLGAGRRIAAVMMELFADLDPGHEMVRRFALVTPDELARLKVLATTGGDGLTRADRAMLVNLPFRVVVARHRLTAIDDDLKAAIVAARHDLRRTLPAPLQGAVAFFEQDRYNEAACVLDNVLYGRIAGNVAGAADKVPQLAIGVLDELGLRAGIQNLGLDFHVGIAGSRLAAGERSRVAMARALLRRPDILVLDDVLGSFDSQCRANVMEILREEAALGMTVVAAIGDVDQARGFDRIVTMERGRVTRQEDREGMS